MQRRRGNPSHQPLPKPALPTSLHLLQTLKASRNLQRPLLQFPKQIRRRIPRMLDPKSQERKSNQLQSILTQKMLRSCSTRKSGKNLRIPPHHSPQPLRSRPHQPPPLLSPWYPKPFDLISPRLHRSPAIWLICLRLFHPPPLTSSHAHARQIQNLTHRPIAASAPTKTQKKQQQRAPLP